MTQLRMRLSAYRSALDLEQRQIESRNVAVSLAFFLFFMVGAVPAPQTFGRLLDPILPSPPARSAQEKREATGAISTVNQNTASILAQPEKSGALIWR